MPTKPRSRDEENQGQATRPTGDASGTIGAYVLSVLGQPLDLHQVQVRRLWDDHYRVNILVGSGASSVKVAHSYFLVVDEGRIVESVPAITRQY